jgi:glycosyltransferase involved in cell wall biosynthesis
VSDLWPLSAYELGALGKGKLYNMLERLEQYLYRASYACTGQSGDIIKHISQDGKRRTQLFRNGVDISRFHAVKYERAHKQIRLVYTGLIGVAQDILSLCKAIDFSQHSAELHIYGDGAERVQLQEYLNSCPNRNIFLHAPVSKSTIPELLGSYDCALIPLVKEIKGAVPSKIYEAMAAGLPIVFAGGGEGAQIVEEHALGWVCNPGDYANMQRIIKEVVATPPERIQQIRDNCRKAAENIFSRDKQILNLHQFLLSSK